jgi:hypothetical protein
MLKCASADTYEIDDLAVAFKEIKTQLDKKITLLDHTVGIIMCHSEFIDSGALRHICENLPFDVVGITSAAQVVNDEAGELILTIFVMTSDDVWFKAGVTGSLRDCIDEPIQAAYREATAGESGEPKLAIIFPPFLIEKYGGDAYIEAWKKIIPNTPFFGSLAIDDTVTFKDCETIYNGNNKNDVLPFIMCYGNINPRFLVSTLPEDKSFSTIAEVTNAKENFVYEINNMPTRKFFAEHGIPESMGTVPFVLDLKKRKDYDGVCVIAGNATFSNDGAAVFYGYVDEGATFSLANFAPDDILSSSRREIEQINTLPDANGALLFPCVVRRMPLMGIQKSLSELQIAKETIRSDIPFMMGYSGGQICPTSIRDGIPVNRFQSYSLIILVI